MKASSRVSVVLVLLALMVSLAACTSPGPTGAAGPAGRAGHTGARGPTGAPGANGAAGSAGSTGAKGARGSTGAAGTPGGIGPMGLPGPMGAPGSGEAAEFYALMPFDNPVPLMPGANVDFPHNGPSTTGDISRTGPGSFDLATVGVYQVAFQVSVDEAAQLVVTLNGVPLAPTVVGRATGTTQITLTALVQTTVADSTLAVQNPPWSSISITITDSAGGTEPSAATLLIELVKAG
jgi:hypothetical protein